MADRTTKAPKTYDSFVQEFPRLGEAWESMRRAEEEGPFDRRTIRLLKLAVAVGSGKEGPVHSSVRKARSAGVSDAEIRHVVALAASTIGLPPAVAAYSWVIEELAKGDARKTDGAVETVDNGTRNA
ncbi:MAG: carboxymuconolactone decarboxylase family protein [Candidatus Binatia bacterium]